MKVSVSLPAEDVEFLDAYAESQGMPSRSAALHRAVRLLRANGLGSEYEEAWQEWSGSTDADLWDTVTGDGLGPDASR
jgi:Arc/MetJ-type ribon-helix-helix transcriptional regulator